MNNKGIQILNLSISIFTFYTIMMIDENLKELPPKKKPTTQTSNT